MSTKQVHNYEGMDLVKRQYVELGKTDTEFAAHMSATTHRLYSVAQVRSYRQALDIPNNAAPSRAPREVYIVLNGEGKPEEVYTDPEAARDACAPSWSYSAFILQ